MKNLFTAIFAVFFILTMFCCGDGSVGTSVVDDLSDTAVAVDVIEDTTESVVVEDVADEEIVVVENDVINADVQGE